MEEERDTDHRNGAKCTLQAHSVCACVCEGAGGGGAAGAALILISQ